MSLDAGRARLFSGYKTLQEQWGEVQLYWHDVVQKEFTEQHWEPLEPCVIRMLAAIDRLGQVLFQAKQDCS
jgi:hypothetical protein